MGLLDRIKGVFSPKKEERFFNNTTFFSNNNSGVVSSKEQAMSIAAVTGCVRAISTAVASLPLSLYRREEDGDKILERSHILYKLLHSTPNSINTSSIFIELKINPISSSAVS